MRTGTHGWRKWVDNYCPECEAPIIKPFQTRCAYCKVLFDWSEHED
jgi:hypothetical protein